MPTAQRKRVGCWNCKRKHWKCDQTRPNCLRCLDCGLECEGYGRTRTAFRNVNPVAEAKVAMRIAKRDAVPQNVPPSHPFSLEDLSLFYHYTTLFSSSMSITPAKNIWRDRIAPLALDPSSSYLLDSIFAISDLHKEHMQIPRFLPPVAAKYYHQAIIKIQTLLSNNTAFTDSMIASILLLLWFEILAGDEFNWDCHFRGFNRLISLRGLSIFKTPFGVEIIEAFARIDVQDAIDQRRQPLLDPEYYDALWQPTLDYAPDIDEAGYLAFQRLNCIWSRIARINGHVHSSSTQIPLSSRDALLVLSELELWYSALPIFLRIPYFDPTSPFLKPQTSNVLIDTLNIHYLSAALFLRHLFKLSSFNLPLPSSHITNASNLILAQRICCLVAGLGPPEVRHNSPYRGDVGVLLPCVIAGRCLENPAEQTFISDWLRAVNRENLWCGYRRQMSLHAYWRQKSPDKHILDTRLGGSTKERVKWQIGDPLLVMVIYEKEGERMEEPIYIEADPKVL